MNRLVHKGLFQSPQTKDILLIRYWIEKSRKYNLVFNNPLKATAACVWKRDITEEGNNEPDSLTWISTPAGVTVKCHQISSDSPICFHCSCENYTELFSVSRLSSLTETKRLSFLLTPSNSLKCHRNTFGKCWMEATVSSCCFPIWCFDPLASVYSSSHDQITTVVFSSTRSSISFRFLVLHEAKVKCCIITIAVSHGSQLP